MRPGVSAKKIKIIIILILIVSSFSLEHFKSPRQWLLDLVIHLQEIENTINENNEEEFKFLFNEGVNTEFGKQLESAIQWMTKQRDDLKKFEKKK